MTAQRRLIPDPQPGYDPDTLLTAGNHDHGNAECMHYLYGGQFRYCKAYGWVWYNGEFWDKTDAEAYVIRAATDTLIKRRIEAVKHSREALVSATRPSATNTRNCLYLFESLVTVDVAEFDQSPDLLNCHNGVLDLRSGQLAPHDPKQCFTYALPVDYDPGANSQEWEKFLQDVTDGKQEIINYVQLCLGYSLTGHTWEEMLFYLHGPARSGKGVFTETILAMMGKEPLATEVDFVTFTNPRDHDAQNFDLAPLKPCRFVAASESTKYQAFNTAKIKQLTGGNYIRCAFKHKDHFTFRPQFKIWLASNFPVNADPDDEAVWYRVRVIPFPNSYVGKEDKALKAHLQKPENLRGVLRWAVEGARKWYALDRHQGIQTPEIVQDATDKAQNGVDFVQQWLTECTEKTDNDEDQQTNQVLYINYERWCKNSGVTPKHQTGLTQALKAKGYKAGEQITIQGRDPTKDKDRQARGCKGIRIVKEPVSQVATPGDNGNGKEAEPIPF